MCSALHAGQIIRRSCAIILASGTSITHANSDSAADTVAPGWGSSCYSFVVVQLNPARTVHYPAATWSDFASFHDVLIHQYHHVRLDLV